jgi:signal transduction histidine kinase
LNLDHFTEIVRVLPEATLLLTEGGEIVVCNPAAADILLRSSEQLRGCGIVGLVAEPEDKVRSYLRACTTTRQMVFGSLSLVLPDGDLIPCRAEGAVLRPREASAPALILMRLRPKAASSSNFMLLNSQITSLNKEILLRRRVEEELRGLNERLELEVKRRTSDLRSANEELTRSNRELQDFAYVASHDLQEPLRKIITFTDLLLEEVGDRLSEAERSYLARMHSAAHRMNALIRGLLDYSRLGTQTEPFRIVDLNSVVRDIVTDLEITIKTTGGHIDISALPKVSADPVQMRQLFQNLIGNGLKFSRPGIPPVVKIFAVSTSDGTQYNREENSVVIRVEDNGIGFDNSFADKIFIPFQRLHGRSQYEGTGMGLAICRRIVQRHGGFISAYGKPGIGSIFDVVLPVHQQEVKPADY